MKVQATLTNLRISPRKTRLVTRALVGANVDEALLQLGKQTKKASGHLVTLLKSAIANAENNNGLQRASLVIEDVRVGDGPKLKRWLPRAFGRATPLIRRGCNVTIILTSTEASPARKAKIEAKKEVVAAAEETPKKTVTNKPARSATHSVAGGKETTK
jgi:large subunit ribosomal protein L22